MKAFYLRNGSLVVVAVPLLAAACVSQAGNWPGWRGPTGLGSTDEQDLPLRWDGKTKENLHWKVPLGGIGNSSPIAWNDRVFVMVSRKQTNREQDAKSIPDHWVTCFRAGDSQELWRTAVPPGHYPRGYGIYAVPTPVTDFVLSSRLGPRTALPALSTLGWPAPGRIYWQELNCRPAGRSRSPMALATIPPVPSPPWIAVLSVEERFPCHSCLGTSTGAVASRSLNCWW